MGSYTNNRHDAIGYDPAGNISNDGGQYSYDATGQQRSATYPPSWNGYTLSQSYDGDGLRAQKVDNGAATYSLRSSVLGGQVVCEINQSGQWTRGYVYLGGELIAVQSNSGVHWVQADPVVKSQRMTNAAGNWEGWLEMDPWGGETTRSGGSSGSNPHLYGSYTRDGNGNDQAMARSYHGYFNRFDQPDPSNGSYSLTDPQSLNRYSYVENDPVNFVDPSGLDISPYNWLGQALTLWSGGCVDLSGEGGVVIICMGSGGAGIGNGGGGTEGGSGDPPTSAPQKSSNPNCIMNALSSSRGLARTYGDVLPNGTINHPGVHALAPLGERATVSTLPVLTGVVLGPVHIGGEGGGDGTHIVDVLLDNGNVAIYADLVTVNVHPGQRLNAGTAIGTVGGTSDPKNYSGLHFGLLNGNGNGRAADRAYRSRTARGVLSPEKNFINPLGPNSPVNCPGVTADPAGVPPVP